MSTIEDLKRDKAANDQEITELKGKIKNYDDKIERGEKLEPDQKEQLARWSARLSELTQSNDKLNQLITELSKPPVPAAQLGIDARLDAIIAGQESLANNVTGMKRKMREAEVEMADVWSESKRSKSEQAPFKDSLITTYQRAGPPHSSGALQVLCMVLNKPLIKSKVIASHLWKHAEAKRLPIIGLDENDVNDPRNGLLLAKSIEEAFDIKHVCFLYNPINQQFTFRVLNPSLLPKRIYTPDPKILGDYNYLDTFASLNNQPLHLPKGVFPYRRVLGFHARCAFKFARRAQWITDADYQLFLQQESVVWKAQGQPPWYSVGAQDPDEEAEE